VTVDLVRICVYECPKCGRNSRVLWQPRDWFRDTRDTEVPTEVGDVFVDISDEPLPEKLTPDEAYELFTKRAHRRSRRLNSEGIAFDLVDTIPCERCSSKVE
jgi:DNA-directed RNA polymerase subunit RPC12/RpoP